MAKTKSEPAPTDIVVEVAKKLTRTEAVERFSRDEHGLLKNVDYVFKQDGSVDWKKMIPDEYVVLNTQYFKDRNIEEPISTNGLEDKQLLVLLGGFKELAKLRGIKMVERRVVESSNDRAVVVCTITFTESYESRAGMPIEFTEVANATLSNTNSFSQFFLETIASNRAFVRCLRNALRIDIVGSDELVTFASNTREQPTEGGEAWHALVDAAKEYSTTKYPEGFKSFEEFKAVLIEKKTEGAEAWNDWKDIPPTTIFKLIGLLKKAKTA